MLRLITLSLFVLAQSSLATAGDSLQYKLELQSTLASGTHNPLWLSANRYGLSSLDTDNGYLRAAVAKDGGHAADRKFDWGAGLDMAVAYGFTSTTVVQQAYAEGRWLYGLLTIGSKEQPMQFRNQQLSSGPQTLGVNARPVPEIRLSVPDYWAVPLGGRWVSFKGHVAFGKYSDSRWQRDFTHEQTPHTDGALHHSKAGYMRIHKRGSPLTIEGGIEMATQFGGRMLIKDAQGEIVTEVKNRSGILSFWHALAAGGHEVTETGYLQNVEGNMLGSWMARLTWSEPTWEASVYADHYFEDHSSMFLLEYTGYGRGDKWDTHTRKRFMLYPLKDMQLGAELKLPGCPWLQNVVVEYLYTKYQSGPIYWDRAEGLSEHIGGRDSYYNHSIYTGWQHWGMVMGNPLYRSPLYNSDSQVSVESNRFIAWHMGLCGQLSPRLSYRLLATTEKAWGTYSLPFTSMQRDQSLMGELTYALPRRLLPGLYIRCAAAIDRGRLLGDNSGLQITVTKKGRL